MHGLFLFGLCSALKSTLRGQLWGDESYSYPLCYACQSKYRKWTMTNNMFSLEKRKRGGECSVHVFYLLRNTTHSFLYCSFAFFTKTLCTVHICLLALTPWIFIFIKYCMYIMLVTPVKNTHEFVFFTLNTVYQLKLTISRAFSSIG